MTSQENIQGSIKVSHVHRRGIVFDRAKGKDLMRKRFQSSLLCEVECVTCVLIVQQLHSICMMTFLRANYPCLLQLKSHAKGEPCSSLVGGVVQRSCLHLMPKATPPYEVGTFSPSWWVYKL